MECARAGESEGKYTLGMAPLRSGLTLVCRATTRTALKMCFRGTELDFHCPKDKLLEH